MSLLVKGGRVVDPANGLDGPADLRIAAGRIAEIGLQLPPAEGEEVLAAEGLLVLPGLVDLHAHLGEPGREERETIRSGSLAAARGGFTTVLMMPDTDPPLDTPLAMAAVRAAAGRTGVVKVLVAAALTKGLAGKEMPELAELAAAGAAALVQPDEPVASLNLLRRTLQYSRGLVPFIAIQPHDADLAGEGLMHEGLDATVLGMRGIPALAEEVAVAAAIMIAQETGCPLHLSRISTAGAVRLVAAGKADGAPITCDVSPHHLTLTAAAFNTYDPACKLWPPLRPAADVDALVQGLADGVVDCIATDHTPLTAEEKDVELNQAPWGAIGLETAFAQLYTALVSNGRLSCGQLVAALTCRPAALLGLPAAGALTPGYPADFTLVDPAAKLAVAVERLLSRSKNTPLLGRTLQGWPVATFVDGRRVWPQAAE